MRHLVAISLAATSALACDARAPIGVPSGGGQGGGAGHAQAGTGGVAAAAGTSGAANVAGAPGAAGVGSGVAGTAGGGSQPPEGWANRTPAMLPASWPSPRRSPVLVADDQAQKVVLYGGYASALPVQDTWAWDGSAGVWTSFPATPPGVFDDAVATFDERRNRIVVFGGETYPSAIPSNGLWSWTFGDASWIAPPPSGSALIPSPRFANGAVYDYTLDRVLIQGGGNS